MWGRVEDALTLLPNFEFATLPYEGGESKEYKYTTIPCVFLSIPLPSSLCD